MGERWVACHIDRQAPDGATDWRTAEDCVMRQNDLARGMFAQLQSIAGINGLTWITHVELVVGTKHGV